MTERARAPVSRASDQFAGSGKVLTGPATVDLPALRLELAGEDAVVDLSQPVANSARVRT